MSFESELRQALAVEALTVLPSETRAYERVSAAVARSRRRRRTTGIVAAVAVAVLSVGAPLAVTRLGDDRTGAVPAGRTLPGPSDPAWDDISTWPLRGNLEDDAGLVAAVADRFGGRPILLADLDGRRFTVVVTEGRIIFATGQRGDPADRLTATNPEQLGFDEDGAIVVRGGRDLLVATTPDVRSVEVSRGPSVGLDGSVTRTWDRVRLTDGLGTTPQGALTRVRLDSGWPVQTFSTGEADTELPDTACPAPCSDEELAALQVEYVNRLAARFLGLRPEEVSTRTVHLGVVPDDIARTVLVSGLSGSHAMNHVALTSLPGGQVLRSVWVTPVNPTRGTQRPANGAEELLEPVAVDTASIEPALFYQHTAGASAPSLSVWVVAPDGEAVRAVSSDPSRWPSSAAVSLVGGSARLELGASSVDFEEHYEVAVLGPGGSVLGTFPARGDTDTLSE